MRCPARAEKYVAQHVAFRPHSCPCALTYPLHSTTIDTDYDRLVRTHARAAACADPDRDRPDGSRPRDNGTSPATPPPGLPPAEHIGRTVHDTVVLEYIYCGPFLHHTVPHVLGSHTRLLLFSRRLVAASQRATQPQPLFLTFPFSLFTRHPAECVYEYEYVYEYVYVSSYYYYSTDAS